MILTRHQHGSTCQQTVPKSSLDAPPISGPDVYTNDTRSSIVDAPSTMVVNGTQVKIYAWYDNEMGYAHRLVDVALMVGASL